MPEFTGVITEPGLYGDIPEDEYHRDPVPERSLSVSGSKLLLPPHCPAEYEWARRHPHRPSKSMEKGTVVHGMVLGTGQPVKVLDYPDYKTKKAQEDKKAAIAAGMVPQLPHEYAEAEALARAVRDHDTAGGLFAEGDPEVSGFWLDSEFGIWLRMRIDWLAWVDGIPTIGDLKTAKSASPRDFGKAVYDYRYFMQDPHYREGLAALLGCDWQEIDFIFAVVQTEGRPAVMTYRVKAEHALLGQQQNRIAREKFRDCSAIDTWPTWSEDIEDLELSRFAVSQIEKDINDYYR